MRTLTITEKVETRFGSHYVHVSHLNGRVTEVAISSPGKFQDTALAGMLDAIADAANSAISAIAA